MGNLNVEIAHLQAAPYLAGVLGVPEHPRNLGAQKRGEALISAYRNLAITTNTPGFKKLNTALLCRTFSSVLFLF